MASRPDVYRIDPNVNPSAYSPPIPPTYYPTAPLNIKSNFPAACVCHNCHQHIVTRVEKKNGMVTWGAVVGIACLGAPLGCFLGCCLIPLCVDDFKETLHFCPLCSVLLGQYDLFG